MLVVTGAGAADREGACCAAARWRMERGLRTRTPQNTRRHGRLAQVRVALSGSRGSGRYRMREFRRCSALPPKVPHDFATSAYFPAVRHHVSAARTTRQLRHELLCILRYVRVRFSWLSQRFHGEGHDGAVRPPPDRAAPRAEGEEVLKGAHCIQSVLEYMRVAYLPT